MNGISPRAEHRGLRVGLPGFAARRAGPDPVEGSRASCRRQYRLPAGHQRGSCGYRGVGLATGQSRPRPATTASMRCGTARVRGRSQRGRVPPRQCGGLLQAWWGACDRRRRPCRKVLHAAAPDGPLLQVDDDAGAGAGRVQEYLDFGIHGWALSRYSGCWVAFKALADTVETSASVDVDPFRVKVMIPDDFAVPEDGLNIRWPDPPLVQERRLLHHTSSTRRWRIAAPTSSTRCSLTRPSLASASSPRARATSMYGRRSTTWESTKRWRRRSASAFSRSAWCGRSRPRVSGASPMASTRYWWSRRSASCSNTSSRKSSTTGARTCARG